MLRFFLVLLSLLILATACGGKPASSKLKISTSFAAANGGYPGGLVITGRNDLGAVFSKHISYSAASTSGLDILLPNGVWTFHAVGWSSSPTTNATCGSASQNLSGSDINVDLTLNPSNCSTATFGNPTFYGSDFKSFNIGTCGSFYTAASSGSYTPLTTSDSVFGFCNPTNILEPDLVGKFPKSIRFGLADVAINGGPAFSSISECIPYSNLSGGHSSSPTTLKFPTKNFPVLIELYENDGCSGNLMTNYYMREGIDSTYDFDHQISALSGFPHLFLLTSDSRKGYSSFTSIFPKFKCLSTTCLPLPSSIITTSPSSSIITTNGSSFLVSSSPGPTNCSNIGTVNLSGSPITPPQYQCNDQDGKIILSLQFSGPSCQSVPCLLNISSLSFNQYVLNDPARSPTIYSDAYDLIGTDQVSPTSLTSSLNVFFEDTEEKLYGLLKEPKSMFNPGGPGGIFGPSITCGTDTATKIVSFYDKGSFKTYQIELANNSLQVPTYLCKNDDLTPPSCTIPNFNKKIIARRLINSVFRTERVINFSCSNRVGLMETQAVKIEGSKTKTERSLIGWNTQIQSYSRADEIKEEVESDSAYSYPTRHESSYKRIEKNQAADGAFFVGKIIRYNTNLDTGTIKYNEYSSHRDFNLNNSRLSVSEISSSHQNIVAGQRLLLNDPFYLGADGRHSSGIGYVVKSNSFGDMVAAWSVYNGSTYDLRLAIKYASDSTTTYTDITLGNASPLIPHLAINDSTVLANRFPVVTFESYYSPYKRLYILRYVQGTGWRDHAGNSFIASAFASNSPNDVQTSTVIFHDTGTTPFHVYFGSRAGSSRYFSALRCPAATGACQVQVDLQSIFNSDNYTNMSAYYEATSGFVYVGANAYNGSSSSTLDTISCDPTTFYATKLCGSGTFGVNSETASGQPYLLRMYKDIAANIVVARTANNQTYLSSLNPGGAGAPSGSAGSDSLAPSYFNSSYVAPVCLNTGSPMGNTIVSPDIFCLKRIDPSFAPAFKADGSDNGYVNHLRIAPGSSLINSFFTPSSTFQSE